MSPPYRFLLIPLSAILFQSCLPKQETDSTTLPISGGIQVSLHTTGGNLALNETVQISDHWQLSSVGRRHGWVRKLESDEQRALVKAMQGFQSLAWTQCETDEGGRETTLTAIGSGDGVASKDQAAHLGQLLQTLLTAKEIASR